MKQKAFAIILTIICMVFSQSVVAARFGGGKSRGMQRSQPSYNQTNSGYRNNNNNYNQQPNTANNYNSHNSGNTTPQRSGMGAGTAAALGATAGAVGGYMLGKSVANSANNGKQVASGTTEQANSQATTATNGRGESKFPWGIIAILVILLVIGLAFFRKKSRPEFSNSGMMNQARNQNDFNIPEIKNRHGVGANSNSQEDFFSRLRQTNNKNNLNSGSINQTSMNSSQNQPDSEEIAFQMSEFMPDGIEKIYFLRQAKGIFLHIQSMNNPENLSEVAKYLTPELYEEIKVDIANNFHVADFNGLSCSLLNAKVENDQLFASVRFDGEVSEDPDKPMQKFSEIWNFLKPNMAYNRWLVAGIQQLDTTVATKNG